MGFSSAPGGIRTEVICSKCGKATSVPFAPTPGRPVFCRECFSTQPARGPPGAGGARFGSRAPVPSQANERQRMMAQGRKGHFMHDAKAVLGRMEGGMDDQHVRAFLEGLFARGARTSTAAAKEFLHEKVTEELITEDQGRALADLVERYSFWR